MFIVNTIIGFNITHITYYNYVRKAKFDYKKISSKRFFKNKFLHLIWLIDHIVYLNTKVLQFRRKQNIFKKDTNVIYKYRC